MVLINKQKGHMLEPLWTMLWTTGRGGSLRSPQRDIARKKLSSAHEMVSRAH